MGSTSRSDSARWLAIALTGVLAVGVGVLAIAAHQHANPDLSDLAAEPAPTFDLGVETAEPTPEATQTAEAIARSEERFFAIGDGAWWRATAGSCGTAEPLIERSTDAGATWIDVTPRYRNIGQIASLDPLAGTEAEMVSSMGEACETQALRTYTQGTYSGTHTPTFSPRSATSTRSTLPSSTSAVVRRPTPRARARPVSARVATSSR